ncbi:hypothetical protein B5G43_09210 [Flavonifractor sp. An92]|nr:FAD-dependent oxidoreductase [Flavonifractor sp. An135]OUN06333.1 hypothetical protein B5G43_09210 [Flavonifractor sp. An92]OUQ23654.1 hypothetical protein B5E80_09010 [Flavonifractor sp. An135]
MLLSLEHTWDVLVAGSGIAGLSAALEAAEAGCSVLLLTSTHLFSGSSFYPGTWGLGLIGPEAPSDRADLCRSIQAVGCGMADPALVEVFVDGIAPAIEKVRDMGVKLRRAVQKDQREFIPCFDHKARDWNGLEFDCVRPVFNQRLEALGVTTLEGCEVLELVRSGSRVCGVVAVQDGSLRYLGCRSLVLATGGYGSLFRYHLCTGDVSGLGQALALEAGASLVNMEFMQMMPGYLSPAPKTIFNEKAFRFSHFRRGDGAPLLPPGEETHRLLEERSGHGPFTSRLSDRAVDVALFRAFLADPAGVEVTYSEEMRADPPEFIRTYFDWLEREKGLTAAAPVQIGIFAHAANGGVAIDAATYTGVPGLFACGEVTGGMHGADRIGGLSTANGLVFGGRAGRAAAAACVQAPLPSGHVAFEPWTWRECAPLRRRMQNVMFRSAMVLRSEQGLTAALEELDALEAEAPREPGGTTAAVADSRRLAGQLTTARAILRAARLRRESRGSHYREDFPAPDPAQARPIQVWLDRGVPTAQFVKEGFV